MHPQVWGLQRDLAPSPTHVRHKHLELEVRPMLLLPVLALVLRIQRSHFELELVLVVIAILFVVLGPLPRVALRADLEDVGEELGGEPVDGAALCRGDVRVARRERFGCVLRSVEVGELEEAEVPRVDLLLLDLDDRGGHDAGALDVGAHCRDRCRSAQAGALR